MTQRIFDDFDDFSSDYRAIHDRNIRVSGADSGYFSHYKVLKVKKAEKDGTIRNILDFGCGDGNSCVFFEKVLPGASLHGIDISEKSIAEARKNLGGRHSFSVFDGIHIPYESDFFDVVFIACVFHHIDAKFHQEILQECLRVLRPQGRLYLFEHNPLNPLTRKIVRECVFDRDAILLPAKMAKALMRQARFQDIRLSYTIFFPRFGILKKLEFLENLLAWLPLGGQYFIRARK